MVSLTDLLAEHRKHSNQAFLIMQRHGDFKPKVPINDGTAHPGAPLQNLLLPFRPSGITAAIKPLDRQVICAQAGHAKPGQIIYGRTPKAVALPPISAAKMKM